MTNDEKPVSVEPVVADGKPVEPETPAPTDVVRPAKRYDWNNAKSRAAARQAVSKLNRRKAQGETLGESDIALLADYEAHRRKPGRKPKASGASAESSSTREGIDKPGTPPLPKIETPVIDKRRSLSPPPTIHVDGEDDWKLKYGAAQLGRELLCTTAADMLLGTLATMEADIRDAGHDPITDVSSDKARRVFVLAMDELIPQGVVATPSIIAVYKMTAITTQRWWRRHEIKKSKERKHGRLISVMPTAMAQPVEPPAPTVERAEPKPEPAVLTIVKDTHKEEKKVGVSDHDYR